MPCVFKTVTSLDSVDVIEPGTGQPYKRTHEDVAKYTSRHTNAVFAVLAEAQGPCTSQMAEEGLNEAIANGEKNPKRGGKIAIQFSGRIYPVGIPIVNVSIVNATNNQDKYKVPKLSGQQLKWLFHNQDVIMEAYEAAQAQLVNAARLEKQ